MMGKKETAEKVKSLLEGRCYGPLKEAAQKWLDQVDEKYGDKIDEIKDKAGDAYEKLGDAAEKYAGASAKFNEKMAGISEKVSNAYDAARENAGPALEKLTDIAETVTEATGKAGSKLSAAGEKFADKFLVEKLKEGVCTVDDLLETFGSEDAREKFGEELADKIKAHAEELKAKGEKFCDCEACRKARSILKDFGVDLEKEAEAAPEEGTAPEAAPAEDALTEAAPAEDAVAKAAAEDAPAE